MMRAYWTLPALVLVAACQQAGETPAAPETEEAPASAAASPAPAVPAVSKPDGAALDEGALKERQDPARLLAYLSTAISAGKWDDAARAWRPGEMDGAKLKAEVGGSSADEGPLLSFGKGEQEGAAGSLYYQAPVILTASGASPREGTIVLRRVNDVDGAEEWQLNWHVERIEWKAR